MADGRLFYDVACSMRTMVGGRCMLFVVHDVDWRTPTTISTAFIAETLPPKGFTSRQKVSLPATSSDLSRQKYESCLPAETKILTMNELRAEG
jgi:hypothetical protein